MRAVALSILLLTAPAVAFAHPDKHSPRLRQGHVRVVKESPRVAKRRAAREVYFTPGHVRVIRQYYAPQYRSLPPGLQKKLYRTGQLPPGWQKRMQPFPVVVERRLGPLPPYYRRGVIDHYGVVYDPRRNVVIDVTPLW